MVDKRVYVKNIRSWFTDWNWKQNPHGVPIKITDRKNLKASYIKYFDEVKPIDEHNPVYLFTSQAWFFGINLHSIQKLINNSQAKFKRNTFLISVFICDKELFKFQLLFSRFIQDFF